MEKSQVNTNFVQVIEGSHFWPSFETLINYLEAQKDIYKKPIDIDYLLIGLKNSLAQGYDIQKVETKPDIQILRFYRTKNYEWFVDLPEFLEIGGSTYDLQMIQGADGFLESLCNNKNEVFIQFSVNCHLDGKLILAELKEGGAVYREEKTGYGVYLCNVVRFVFGTMPKTIYYEQVMQ
jgi:hypothetical protein